MLTRAIPLFAVVLLCGWAAAAGAAVTPYGQSFEGLVQTDPNALGDDGWVVYGNVYYADTTYFYGYGTFPAPNHALAFSQIVTGEGGPSQEAQQLVVFSDYENTGHGLGYLIESNFFREYTIDSSDVGTGWVFEFDAKLGNIAGGSTAHAFIKTIDPANGYAATNFITLEMTSIPVEWQRYRLTIALDSMALAGQLLQFGFMNLASNYEGSGIYYDNIEITAATVDVPGGAPAVRAMMEQNRPNPFNPTTRIDFSLDRPGAVEIAVFDISGRRVATLYEGMLRAGDHSVTWDGRSDRGEAVSSGLYLYVLNTPTDRLTRRMMLVR